MNPSTARLPIAIFVLTLFGVVLLYWHNRNATLAQNRQLATAQEFRAKQDELASKVAQLRREQPTARIDYKELTVSLPRVSATSAAPTALRATPHTVIVPTIAPANNTAAAREVAAADRELHASQEAVVAASASPTGNAVFGVDRNVVTLVFSVIILGACLYVILSKKYPEGTDKWAYASVGTILGHWFAS